MISRLKSQFARHGIPDQVMRDHGRPLNLIEFQEVLLAYESEHLTSPPRYRQSNGKAEKSLSWIIGTLPQKELEDGSPAQRLFGRRTGTLLPTSSRLRAPDLPPDVSCRLKEETTTVVLER